MSKKVLFRRTLICSVSLSHIVPMFCEYFIVFHARFIKRIDGLITTRETFLQSCTGSTVAVSRDMKFYRQVVDCCVDLTTSSPFLRCDHEHSSLSTKPATIKARLL